MRQVKNGLSLTSAASTGTLAFMSQFGIASTGTAISTLSGVAATNATLAALGGGAVTSGGGGMALGSTVLGGVTVLPAAIVMSWRYAKTAEKALTLAHKQYADTKKEIEKVKVHFNILVQGVDVRIEELDSTLKKLSKICSSKILPNLNSIYESNKNSAGNISYDTCTNNEKSFIALAAHFIRGLNSIMRVKVLDENGNPSETSRNVLLEIKSDNRMSGI